MTHPASNPIETLRRVRRCRPEVQAAAAALAGLAPDQYAQLIQQLLTQGQDRDLGILLNVCAVNRVVLSAELLAETLTVVEPLTDFSLPYKFQNADAIPPLLAISQSEELSWQRQAYAVLVAAEMSKLHGGDPKAVQQVVAKLETQLTGMQLDMLLVQAKEILALDDSDLDRAEFLIRRDALNELPEERPPVVIGEGFTVRRPIPKIGRNAPCHCGSGKKYKKCCAEKDQNLLRDASPYEGLTMSEVRHAPHLTGDTRIIEEMRAYELKQIAPADLNPDQLLVAYRRSDLYGLREQAFEFLLELDRRPDVSDFDRHHFDDLLFSCQEAGDVVTAEKILDRISPEELLDPELHLLTLNLLKNRPLLDALNDQIRKSFSAQDEFHTNDPLIHYAHTMQKNYPALSIVFARAAIMGNPDRVLDNEMLIEAIRRARADLNLNAWTDPVEDFFDWWSAMDEAQQDKEFQNKEIRDLNRKVAEARKQTLEKEKELRRKEDQLSELTAQLRKTAQRQHAGPKSGAQPKSEAQKDAAALQDRTTISRLRERIDALKGEISAQQHLRRQVQRQLQLEKEKLSAHPKGQKPQLSASRDEHQESPIPQGKKILIPEFTPAFRRSCERLDPPIVAKALKAAAGFAAHDEMVRRQTRPLHRLPGGYRIRIGIHHRLLLHWVPDETLEVLDLIQRAQLDTWLRRRV